MSLIRSCKCSTWPCEHNRRPTTEPPVSDPLYAELARLRRELAERDERISEAVKAWRMGKISALKLADRLEGKK